MSSINAINNGSITGSIISSSIRSRPDPAEKFKELDTDGNGGLDKTELSALGKELAKMTGKTLDVDASITTYDANGDGLLSRQEMDTMMRETMGPPPDGAQGTNNQSTTGTTGSLNQDQLTILLKMLGDASSASSTTAPTDPASKFKELDSDSSGGLNQAELDTMAKDIASSTGQTVDFSKALSTFDTDGNGELSQTEVDAMMKEKMGPPPPPPPGMGGGTDRQQVTNAYLANSGEDQLSRLRQLLEQMTGEVSSNTGSTSSSS